MRALSGSDFLSLWERGVALHAVDRGLLALSAAFPDVSFASLADWTLGRRNRALIELHYLSLGPSLEGWTSCASCGEKMEFEIDARALKAQSVPEVTQGTVRFKKHAFRLPTSRDLAVAAKSSDEEAAVLALIHRCSMDRDSPADWDKESIEELGAAMTQADPLAEIGVALCCPACGAESEETIEIVSFLWSEIEARAKRLLVEVHAIASAYGWTEAEILSLSQARRSLYAGMVHA